MRQIMIVILSCVAFTGCNKDNSPPALEPTLAEAGRPLSTTLSGAEEVNAVGQLGVGDPDGTGLAELTLNSGQEEVCFEISVENIDPPTRAHIHAAPAGVNGDITVAFVEADTPDQFVNGVVSGCVTVTAQVIKDIRQNASNYYVNVHNPAFPAGAVRGQLGD